MIDKIETVVELVALVEYLKNAESDVVGETRIYIVKPTSSSRLSDFLRSWIVLCIPDASIAVVTTMSAVSDMSKYRYVIDLRS